MTVKPFDFSDGGDDGGFDEQPPDNRQPPMTYEMTDDDKKLLEREVNLLQSYLWNVRSWAMQGAIRSCLSSLGRVRMQTDVIQEMIAFKGWAKEEQE